MDRRSFFEKRIQPILQYVGVIGAILMSIMYIIIVVILIIGFKAQSIQNTIVFAVINAIVGLMIMQFLKIQGISFAKNLPENIEIIKQYYNTKTKDKKIQSIKYYWTSSLIKDFISKGLSIAFTTAGIIYIVIVGSNDYTLLLLALANLILFICFGLLALNNAYEFYNNKHVPYMQEMIKNKITKKEIEKCLQSMVKNLEISKNRFYKTKRI